MYSAISHTLVVRNFVLTTVFLRIDGSPQSMKWPTTPVTLVLTPSSPTTALMM
jgi:hypothetical protein